MSTSKNADENIGRLPGTITYNGAISNSETTVLRYKYNKEHFEETLVTDFNQAVIKTPELVSWINVCGLHSAEHIRDIGSQNNIHPLILEDIANTSQRPKIDDYEDYLFIVLKVLNSEDEHFKLHQVSFILKENHVLSFQESFNDSFIAVENRIKLNKGKVRSQGSDYLLYCLIDIIVDQYTELMEVIGTRIEEIENELYQGRLNASVSKEIQQLKRKVLKLRRAVLPISDILNHIITTKHPVIKANTINYFKDINDHVNHITDEINFYREMLLGLNDLFMSGQNNKMNEIMKTLTIISTIFIPLSFIAGVYGMNFENMPELSATNAYYIVLSVMFSIVVAMLFYFKRKDWI